MSLFSNLNAIVHQRGKYLSSVREFSNISEVNLSKALNLNLYGTFIRQILNFVSSITYANLMRVYDLLDRVPQN